MSSMDRRHFLALGGLAAVAAGKVAGAAGADNAAANQDATFLRNEMHFHVRSRQKPHVALSQETGIGQVNDQQLTPCAQPDMRQRFVCCGNPTGHPPPVNAAVTAQRASPLWQRHSGGHVCDPWRRAHVRPTACRRHHGCKSSRTLRCLWE